MNITKILILILVIYFSINAYRIYQFSKVNTTKNAALAVVLGAGTSNGKLSAVFKERINHSIKLYQEKRVEKIIFTGGFGKNETISDSQVAKKYAMLNGVSESDIFIEEKSRFTFENLEEAKLIMDSLHFKNALLVSDPLHMKRSVSIAEKIGVRMLPSPTSTSMYKSKHTKLKFLIYETFYFSLGEIYGRN